ncbi:glycogen debranching protein GlgX [Sphingomonas crocodyli]|uniref:Glycogen debranching enzyme GlgX n=1 Tax=Sphingomonas crocodyli TaxID=1979270 RepID=A0A437M9Q3_9SPHN|nr:glycogen debranching protein GlgX [Sphingomonas crocodyli]RVT94346.1 glycogen debranching enzyme GlgX [Sphingomonas crocodyli]
MIRFGATPTASGTHFALWSECATEAWVCMFDGDKETRVPMQRGPRDVFQVEVEAIGPGARYGFRADGPYDPDRGHWFDPNKLLTDPYAVRIDRPYVYDLRLAAPRGEAVDTAPLMPKAIVEAALPGLEPAPPHFTPGGLIYEVSVRGFTRLHPAIPERHRGTIAALAHPTIIDHLKAIGVSALELMPIAAWIDERHLPALGLTNSWGYNPVSMMALDPRLAPGGIAELRDTVAALHAAGIGVILDVVFNHTGESDRLGPTLSLRGLDALAYFRHADDDYGVLANDSGTGNTLDCDHPATRRLVLDTLRHFVTQAGIDGFRFDLAPVLGRLRDGFDPHAALLEEMRADPILADRILIAEPWDIGPGGYQLGNFPAPFLEWNDRYRDDVRRFWRGDPHAIGDLVTRLAGSSDTFGRGGVSRSVNFIAAHDGFTLADVTAFAHKHNEANGEQNRDGHHDNLSWNNGVEGATDDPAIIAARRRDVAALLATLFVSRGTIMLTAGDEFGRTQRGNNNAYCQDNDLSWIDWDGRDRDLESQTARLARFRAAHPAVSDPRLLGPDDVDWLTPDGRDYEVGDWHDPAQSAIVMLLHLPDQSPRVAIAINRGREAIDLTLPGGTWRPFEGEASMIVEARSVGLFVEQQP